MKAAIIAAGKGERFAHSGIATPKPLIPVGGAPLISRTIRSAARAGAASVACIVNDLQPGVAEYLRAASWPVPLELLVKTTPSSMESLFGLAPLLSGEPFLMLTVDAVFAAETLERFLAAARGIAGARGVLALTRYVADETPLWARMDDRSKIIALGDAAPPTPFVTAGFYYFHPEIFTAIGRARSRKLRALRHFLGLLVQDGLPLYGVEVPKTIDVDTPDDLKAAEAFFKGADADV